MDNVTHTLCAMALARAGLDRAGPWSTPTLVIASNLPDVDGYDLLWGDKPGYLEIHRGLTHSVLGLVLQAVLLGLLVSALVRHRGGPIRSVAAIAVSLAGFLTHLALDALNSYGIRPWLPFDGRWLYFDVAFVADPWILLILTMAAALGGPRGRALGWWILAATGAVLLLSTSRAPLAVGMLWTAGMAAVVLSRMRGAFAGRSRRIALLGLSLLAVYLVLLGAGSRTANRRGMAALAPRIEGAVQRTSTHAQPGIPWRFRVIAQTETRLYRDLVDLLAGTVSGISTLPRGLDDPLLLNAASTREHRVWQGFARHPFAGMLGQEILLGDGRYSWAVERGWANLVVPAQDDESWRTEEVGLGVVLKERQYEDLFGAPQSVTVLEIDRDHPAVKLRFADAGGLQSTSELGGATGAVAAVNGGYFAKTGAAVGLLRIDDQILFENTESRQTAIGIDHDESLVIRPAPIGDWPDVPHALSAGPMLVVDGAVDVAPGFAHELVRHPRTALGLTPASLLLVTVDGRNAKAAGMTCDELARFMLYLGCDRAVNLDGGGSTTMWVRGSPGTGVVNHPSDNFAFDQEGERAVGNAVLVLAPDVIVRDNDAASLSAGDWSTSREGTGFLGDDYAVSTAGNAAATWRIEVDLPGRWAFMIRWPKRAGLTREANISVGGLSAQLDQRRAGGEWVTLGEMEIREPRTFEIVLTGNGEGVLALDAVRLVQGF